MGTMAMNIKSERVHALAREAARRTGQSQVAVLESALERYLQALADERGEDATAERLARAADVLHEVDVLLTDEDRAAISEAAELLYDDRGLPR
jgi:antitoxin VapB